jgi:hypothetical protein
MIVELQVPATEKRLEGKINIDKMRRTYICPHSRTSRNISSNLRSTLAESALIWSAISIIPCLMSSISRLSQSASSSVNRHGRFKGRWLAVSRDSALRFPAEFGTSYKSLIRVKQRRFETFIDTLAWCTVIRTVLRTFLFPSPRRERDIWGDGLGEVCDCDDDWRQDEL